MSGTTTIEGVTTSAASSLRNSLSPYAGAWGYRAGVESTPTLPEGARVTKIEALGQADGDGAASFTIDGGDSIPVPEGDGTTLVPSGALVDAEIVFANTRRYVVEFVL